MLSLMRLASISAAVLGVGYMCLGPDTWSVVETARENVISSIRDSRSLGFEIDRADNLLDDAGAEMSDARRRIAEMEVDLESYHQRVSDQAAALEKRRTEIARLSDELRRQAGSLQITIDGTVHERSAVTARIDRLVDQYNQGKVNLKQMDRSHGERAQAVMAARKALQLRQEELVAMRDRIDLQRLSLATESLLDSTDVVNPDLPALADTRQLMDRIEHDLSVSRRMRELKSDATLSLNLEGEVAPTVESALAKADAALSEWQR